MHSEDSGLFLCPPRTFWTRSKLSKWGRSNEHRTTFERRSDSIRNILTAFERYATSVSVGESRQYVEWFGMHFEYMASALKVSFRIKRIRSMTVWLEMQFKLVREVFIGLSDQDSFRCILSIRIIRVFDCRYIRNTGILIAFFSTILACAHNF